MTDKPILREGIRVTVHHTAGDSWAGQNGKVIAIEATDANTPPLAPIRVLIDGEIFPTRFQPSELRPEPKHRPPRTHGARRNADRGRS